MVIFCSYSREDAKSVAQLADVLEAAGNGVWWDKGLGGGESWWTRILENIRRAEVVVFALSDNSLRSKRCRAEVNYALALGRTILPIQVGQVANFRANPLSELQTIRFEPDDAHSAFEVISAVNEAAQRYRPLPEELPEEPPIPYAYLVSLSKQIDNETLSADAQIDVVDQLRKAYRDETEASVHDDIVAMLNNLKRRSWTTVQAAREVDHVLASMEKSPTRTAVPARPDLSESPALTYPTSTDYVSAVQNPRSLLDPDMRRATFELHPLWGIPMPASGDSAVVFKADIDSKPQAIRFFLREAASRRRYRGLHSFVESHHLDDCAAAEWVDDAIMVNGRPWPAVAMQWIEGRSLDAYIEHLAIGRWDSAVNTKALTSLAEAWRDLVRRMQDAGFAHGDLEHGNVLVDTSGRLKLVDFDGSWFEGVDGPAPDETGHPNYQLPGRGWGRWMDTFPGLLVYTALRALAARPEFWQTYGGKQNVLFTKDDLVNPGKTPIWSELESVNDPHVRHGLAQLRAACANPSTLQVPLESVLDGASPRPPAHETELKPAPRPVWRTPVLAEDRPAAGADDVSSDTVAPGRIFVSYRRLDSAYPTGWLYERLAKHFGRGDVVMDIDSIEPGDDFTEVIDHALTSCDLMLVVIGPRWVSITDRDGRRRLEDPDDWVRREVETALQRNIRVIPVLVDGATVPRSDQLPPALAKLSRRQGVELSPQRFQQDTDRLLQVLDKKVSERPTSL